MQPQFTDEQVSELVGMTARQLKGLQRQGLLSAGPEYSFQDLVLLRTATRLRERLPSRQVNAALRSLRSRYGAALSELRITAEGGRVIARDDHAAFQPASGQCLLDFEQAPSASDDHEGHNLVSFEPRTSSLPAPSLTRGGPRAEPNADAWYTRGCELDPEHPAEALEAYLAAIEHDPEHADAHLNAGRLFHEQGAFELAEQHYREAVRLVPAEATGWFNLGVVLEDQSRHDEADEAYERALVCNPRSIDARVNAARLAEKTGRNHDALRHLRALRNLAQR